MVKNRKRNRSHKDDVFAMDEEITSDSEEDQPGGDQQEEIEQDDEVKETAEQKRLRLAKAYLNTLQVKKAQDEDEEEKEGVHEAGVDGYDAISERLEVEALSRKGQYQRHIAQNLIEPNSKASSLLTSRPLKGGGGFHRGPLTAVALVDSDKTKAYTVSKDGALLGWDLESMSRIKDFTSRVRDYMYNRVESQEERLKRSIPLSLAASSDGRYVVAGGTDQTISVWDSRTGDLVKSFPGHKGAITGLTFQKGTNQLFSSSMDRTIKIWSLDDMAYIDTLFGHVAEVNAVDCLRKERLVSVGSDRSCRIWKVPEETQLLFKGQSASVDCCSFVNQSTFVSGSQDGSIGLWSMFKKKAVHLVHNAHPSTDIYNKSEEWISSICAHANSDLVASGAGDGFIRLWCVDEEGKLPRLQEKFKIPVRGYVNSLQFSQDAQILVGAIGQEPRLGRWNRNKSAKNALFVQKLQFDQ